MARACVSCAAQAHVWRVMMQLVIELTTTAAATVNGVLCNRGKSRMWLSPTLSVNTVDVTNIGIGVFVEREV